ncbi:MAG: hypothetical protein IK064_03835, partial [Clostridia bacterium]|nr:hypothetical protein [Clostridia bacterium]
PTVREALAAAEEHGLSKEDLRGEYELFLRFSETVEGNPGLGEYRALVYRIFPVIADHTEYLDAEYFFGKLASLSFSESELEAGFWGLYQHETNAILIREDVQDDSRWELSAVVFHELMHFVDRSMSGAESAMYILDGRRLYADEFLALPMEDRLRTVILYNADAVTEGGAELYTAKYFSGGVRSYFSACSILTGIEYIYGTEKLNELFFGTDSEAVLAELLLDAGYSEDRYYTAAASLNWLTTPRTSYMPNERIAPEDILIDLYEHELGSGWEQDEPFIYILKSLSDVAWPDYERSVHADFLQGIEFNTREQYADFLSKLYAGLSFRPEPMFDPPFPVIKDGRFLITAFADWTDPDTAQPVRGTIAAEYDFGTEQPIGYLLTDMDAIYNEYPVLHGS